MRKVLAYLKTYYNEEFKLIEWLFAILFVMGFCYLNYFTDFISTQRAKNNWSWKQFNFYFILYAVPLFTGYLIQSIHRKDFSIFKKPIFIFLCLASVVMFSTRSMMVFLADELKFIKTSGEFGYYLYANYMTVLRSLVLLVPIVLIWLFLDKNNQPLYGFTRKNFSLKPYFLMLLFMVPLIAMASTQSDFLSSYPRGLKSVDLDLGQMSHLKYFLWYELIYGLDFVNIELFFRGFLILAFLKYAGARAVMPMAMFYVIIHFGKPLGESISSFFGGTLLGIITLYGRSILGGIIVHVGIAYMMEIGALIGRYLKG